MPTGTSPDATSTTKASNGMSPNVGRPSCDQALSPAQTARGRTTVSTTDAKAAAAPRQHIALNATDAAHHSAPWTASARRDGRNSERATPPSADGASPRRHANDSRANSRTDAIAIVQTPRNFPSTSSLSRTASVSSRSMRPLWRSSLQTSIARNAASRGRTTETLSAQTADSDSLPPSASARLNANVAPATARKPPTARAVA